jgi:UDP-glucose 4-epimerase
MSKDIWLLTGAAGYIGSHVADEFLSSGRPIVVYDSLLNGNLERIKFLEFKYDCSIPFIEADIRDLSRFEYELKNREISGIAHLAALKSVNESIEHAMEYFEVNHLATRKISEIATRNDVKKFIFSSTSAVYGSPTGDKACEEFDDKKPITPYGESKLQAEKEVTVFNNVPGNTGISLRFFNVIGSVTKELCDEDGQNLVPILIKRIQNGEKLEIFGTDYPTPDGTCVRDYVDVRDIARAHRMVADFKGTWPEALNIGTGRGASIRKIINLITTVMNVATIDIAELNRRTGDAQSVTANVDLAKTTLGFTAKYSLEDSIRSLF